MGSFNRAKEALEKSQHQGCNTDAEVKEKLEAYERQAEEADRLLREKQARERDSR